VRLKIEGKDEIAETSSSFNSFIEGLHGIMRQVHSNSLQLSSASEQIFSLT
jgi:methyl-accepting chemotaxis protein